MTSTTDSFRRAFMTTLAMLPIGSAATLGNVLIPVIYEHLGAHDRLRSPSCTRNG